MNDLANADSVQSDATVVPARLKPAHWVLIGLIVLLAAALRLYHNDEQCLWFDEIWHAELSTGRGSAQLHLPADELIANTPDLVSLSGAPSFIAIWQHMDWVLHPPLFHTLFRAWREIAGDSVSAWRGLSALFSIAALIPIFIIARRYLGLTAALWAMAICTLSATQIAQARDTRGYTLAMLIGLITSGILLDLARRKTSSLRHAHAIGAGCMAMLFTHYFTASMVCGIALFALMQLRGAARQQTIVSIVGATTMFLLLWGSTLREQLNCVQETADLFLKDPNDGHFLMTLLRVAQFPTMLLSDATNASPPLAGLLAIIGIGIWIAAAYAAYRIVPMRLFFFQLVITALMLASLDLLRTTRHLTFARYALAASPAVYFALGAFTSQSFGKLRSAGLVPIAATIWAVFTVPWGFIQTNDYRPMAGFLHANAGKDEPLILVSNPPGRDGQTIYLYLAKYSQLFPHDLFIATHPVDRSVTANFKSPSGWIVSATLNLDPKLVMPGAVVERAVEFESTGGVGACFHVRFEGPPATTQAGQ